MDSVKTNWENFLLEKNKKKNKTENEKLMSVKDIKDFYKKSDMMDKIDKPILKIKKSFDKSR